MVGRGMERVGRTWSLCCLNDVSADLTKCIDNSCLAVRLSEEAAAIDWRQCRIFHARMI